MRVRNLGGEDPLEKDIATYSSIIAWRIPWTEEPAGLHSIGSKSQIKLKQLSMRILEGSLRPTSLRSLSNITFLTSLPK